MKIISLRLILILAIAIWIFYLKLVFYISKKKDVNLNVGTYSRQNYYGYAFTNEFLFKIEIMDSPLCKCGNVTQDINHILWSCTLYDVYRDPFLDNLISEKLYAPYSLNYLIGNISYNIAKIILSFLHSAQISI